MAMLRRQMTDCRRQGSTGGQSRRLALARLLLSDAPCCLLDEATEGLDAETEQQILALLRQHCRGKTLILVTHRLYGLEHFDRICVMDGGSIVEQGSHAALMRQPGRYAQFRQRISNVSL